MRNVPDKTRRLTADAMLLCTAFILSYIEMLVPVPVPVPGIKLGLANSAILFTLYYRGTADAFFVLSGRIFLSALLFGNASSFIFSAAGGLTSFFVMLLFRALMKDRVVIVSIFGGIFHNIGQLAAAYVIMSVPVGAYMPYLILGGIAAGTLNGTVVSGLLRCPVFKKNRK